jgi:hypothetical protein
LKVNPSTLRPEGRSLLRVDPERRQAPPNGSKGRNLLGANEEALDKAGIDLLPLRNSTKFFFKQVKTEITECKKMQPLLRVFLDGMKPFFESLSDLHSNSPSCKKVSRGRFQPCPYFSINRRVASMDRPDLFWVSQR